LFNLNRNIDGAALDVQTALTIAQRAERGYRRDRVDARDRRHLPLDRGGVVKTGRRMQSSDKFMSRPLPLSRARKPATRR
jgi:hypothetical protein